MYLLLALLQRLFRITVSPDAQIGQYTIPISLNISKGSNFPSKALINVGNSNLPIATKNYADW